MFGLAKKIHLDELKKENENQGLYISNLQNQVALAKAVNEAVKVDSDRFEKEVQALLAYKKDNETLIAKVGALEGQLFDTEQALRRSVGGKLLVVEELKAVKASYESLLAKTKAKKKTKRK